MCQGCEHRLREGKISKLEVRASRILFELSTEHRPLNAINFKRAIEAGGLTILVVGKGEISAVLGRGGKLIRELGRRLQRKVRVIEDGVDIRKQAQDILTPAHVLGINILYRRGGGEEYRVRIPSVDLKKIPASIDVIQALFAKLTDRNIKLVFE